MGFLEIFSNTRSYHGTNLIFFHCITKFLPLYCLTPTQKIHKHTLIGSFFKIKTCLVVSLLSAHLHKIKLQKIGAITIPSFTLTF